MTSVSGPSTTTHITFRYGEREIETRYGQSVLDSVLAAGEPHRHICGGRGFCTSCRVEVLDGQEGLSAVSSLERERLGKDVGRLRLACQARVVGAVHVRVAHYAQSRFSPEGD